MRHAVIHGGKTGVRFGGMGHDESRLAHACRGFQGLVVRVRQASIGIKTA
jgi:hypothetical protein